MKKIAALLIALVAFIAVPSAAFAYSSDSPTVTGTVAPGQTVTVTWPAGTFVDGEPVQVSCNCTSGTPVLTPPTVVIPVFHAGTGTTSGFASEDGSFSVQVTLPNENFGTCSLTVNGISTYVGTGSLTYTPGDLPHTGLDVATYAWAGAGVVALGVALMVVFSARRKAASNK